MDRTIFLNSFTLLEPPQWPCPRCGKSVLQINEKSLHHNETADSRDAHSHEDWDPEWIKENFSCLLKCSNDACKEIVACIGISGINEESESENRRFVNYFIPTFFQPNLVMMDIPSDAPSDVVNELNASFSMFFSNKNAAANSARMAVEALLKHLGIKNFSTSQGRRHPIALHHRIDSMPAKYSAIKDGLKAVKWIGNHGSHAGKKVTTEALLDAYDILEVALDNLYNKKRKQAEKIAKIVNKRKGPRAKK
jgi:hypothetical protein